MDPLGKVVVIVWVLSTPEKGVVLPEKLSVSTTLSVPPLLRKLMVLYVVTVLLAGLGTFRTDSVWVELSLYLMVTCSATGWPVWIVSLTVLGKDCSLALLCAISAD